MLETLSSKYQYFCNGIKIFDFFTLSTIPHVQLKSSLKQLIQWCFSKKNGEQGYLFLVIGGDKSYFVKSHWKSNDEYKQDEIIQIDSIFVEFGGLVFQ